MQCKVELIDYSQTGYFSGIVTDYISQSHLLSNFYQHAVSLQGLQSAILERKKFNTNRQLLVQQLEKQYASIQTSEKVKQNIRLLANDNTFTVCTAHQPNIFTGHLYFIYKILHTIKLVEYLAAGLPGNNFVPIFYVGSEDADLDELGHIFINGEKYEWHTKQTGAVGRMKIDDDLLDIIENVSGQLLTGPNGKDILQIVKSCYTKDSTIQDATFKFTNSLFEDFGLVVLLPDNAELKRTMSKVFEDDLLHNTPSEIVSKTSVQLSQHYKVQAHPREINLFYLKDNLRKRIVQQGDLFKVHDSETSFTKEELLNELHQHPERFSPNVILRGLYQETILPNIAFIGGGGEIAYWLELKDLFQHYHIPFPVLIIRNSFVVIEKKVMNLIEKLGLKTSDIFKPELQLINELVKRNDHNNLSLETEKEQLKEIYRHTKDFAGNVDVTLGQHAEALQVKTLKTFDALEKKMLKAGRKKYEAEQRQIKKIKSALFPLDQLQERVDNVMPYYAKWGKGFINEVYNRSLVLEQKLIIITET